MLSQTCEYALRAVTCLAHHPGEFVTASDLADATSVPADYLSKVLQQLAAAKVVQGRRGVGGGYRLAREPENITLLDIVDAMGVFQRMRTCPTHKDESRGLCPLHKTVDLAVEAAESVFRNKSLADMLNESAEGSRLCVEHSLDEERPGARVSKDQPPSGGRIDGSQPRASALSDPRPQFTANGNLKARARPLGER